MSVVIEDKTETQPQTKNHINNLQTISHLDVGHMIRAGDIVMAVLKENRNEALVRETILILDKQSPRCMKGYSLQTTLAPGRRNRHFNGYDFEIWNHYDFYLFPRRGDKPKVKVYSSSYTPRIK